MNYLHILKWFLNEMLTFQIIFVGLKEKLQCNVYSPTSPLVDRRKVHFPLSS